MLKKTLIWWIYCTDQRALLGSIVRVSTTCSIDPATSICEARRSARSVDIPSVNELTFESILEMKGAKYYNERYPSSFLLCSIRTGRASSFVVSYLTFL